MFLLTNITEAIKQIVAGLSHQLRMQNNSEAMRTLQDKVHLHLNEMINALKDMNDEAEKPNKTK